MGSSLAELQSVSFRHMGATDELLSGVDLKVAPGEVVMLAGANGSGKSTLLGLISGQLRPQSGTVQVLGCNPTRVERAPGLGLITEPFHPEQSPLPADLTLRQTLTWLELLDSISPEDAEAGLSRLRISVPLLDRPIRSFSKGERQRAMLLVVLLRQPRLVLADEPLEGIDRESRQLIGEGLRSYTRTGGRSVLWVSHHLAETLPYADRLLELKERRLVEHRPDHFKIRIEISGKSPQLFSVPSLEILPTLATAALTENSSLQILVEEVR